MRSGSPLPIRLGRANPLGPPICLGPVANCPCQGPRPLRPGRRPLLRPPRQARIPRPCHWLLSNRRPLIRSRPRPTSVRGRVSASVVRPRRTTKPSMAARVCLVFMSVPFRRRVTVICVRAGTIPAIECSREAIGRSRPSFGAFIPCGSRGLL